MNNKICFIACFVGYFWGFDLRSCSKSVNLRLLTRFTVVESKMAKMDVSKTFNRFTQAIIFIICIYFYSVPASW